MHTSRLVTCAPMWTKSNAFMPGANARVCRVALYSVGNITRNGVSRGYRSRAPPSSSSGMEQVSGIWYVPSPTTTDYKQIIIRLPVLQPSKRGRLTSALFFVTPELAKLFESGHPFHREAINHIYQPIMQSCPPESTVVVVDALPDRRTFSIVNAYTDIPFPSTEGIAVCLMETPISSSSAATNGDKHSLVRFHTSPVRDGITTSIILPTANTLFVNGNRTTMFRQAWDVSTGDQQQLWVPKDDAIYLSRLNVPMSRHPNTFVEYEVPFEPLTSARKVVSSMGNVVRELEGDHGKPIKASTELEELVPLFIKDNQVNGKTGIVQVFAMIMPPQEKSADVRKSARYQPNTKIRMSKMGIARAVHMALINGGRLHRVTGGGGGWGKKQGLLSIDTAVDFENKPEQESSMFPSFEDEEPSKELRAATEPIPIGHTVQFFATLLGPEQQPFYASTTKESEKHQSENWTASQWGSLHRHKFILGTAAAREEPISEASKDAAKDLKVTGVPGTFGMLSHSGACLTREVVPEGVGEILGNSPSIHQFRVDVPHAIFRSSWTSSTHKSRDGSSERDADPVSKVEFDGDSVNTAAGGSVESVVRRIRVQRRDANGNFLNLKKHHCTLETSNLGTRIEPSSSLVSSASEDTVKVKSPTSPTLRTQQDTASTQLSAIENPSAASNAPFNRTESGPSESWTPFKPEHSRPTANLHSKASKSTSKSRTPISEPPIQEGSLGSSGALNPLIRLEYAPNNTSWDRVRANVKPGQSPTTKKPLDEKVRSSEGESKRTEASQSIDERARLLQSVEDFVRRLKQ